MMNKKQEALIYAARTCAINYIKQVPAEKDKHERRIKDFISGYCKGMKDCGYDVLDAKTLEDIVIVERIKEDA